MSPFLRGALAALATGALALGQDDSHDPAAVLSGVEKTRHFEVRFRPGSLAEASVDRVAIVVEKDLDGILAELGLRDFPHTIRLFLYDDVAELQKVTGVPSGGHSVPLESHVPHDNDQTRVHELVHVVAEKFTEHGDEPRNLFFAEGLANAVLRFVHGVPVDAVAAFYKKRGELPTLAELHAVPDFYAWLGERPGFNGYDVGGSYMRYLLDTYGPAKVRQYYKGAPAKKAFGADLDAIEKGWHARLDKVRIRPGLQKLLEERAGAGAGPTRPALDDAVLGPASAWEVLDGAPIAAGEPGQWVWVEQARAKALLLSGDKSQGDWCVVRVGDGELGDAIVRCRAEPTGDCFGVQIQLGPKCQAMVLRGQGSFLYNEVGGVGHDPRVQLGTAPVEIVLRRQGGRSTVWVDGKFVAEAAVDGAAAPLSVGCVGGPARFTQVARRRL